MAAIPYKTAEAFVNGKRSANGAFHTDGTAVWSYGLLLAVRHSSGNITVEHPLDGSANVSVTTARHIRALRETLQWAFGGQILLEKGARLSNPIFSLS